MHKKNRTIAVVGATGNVGRAMLAILAEKGFSKDRIVALASKRSRGKEISYGDDAIIRVQALEDFDFRGTSVVLSSAGSSVSFAFVERAIQAGAVVIDNSSAFRMDQNVPLVVPEVNPDALETFPTHGIIANPNCAMIQMAVALKPLDTLSPIQRVVVSTYQSVSGAGKRAMDELLHQTRAIYMNAPTQTEVLPRPIAFNLIPQIGGIEHTGDTGEEEKIVQEFQKVMGRPIPITATAVRVPVFIGHSMSVNVALSKPVSLSAARKALQKAPGVRFILDDDAYTTPIEVVGEDAVYVSRFRKDPSCANAFNLWVVADNLRKGAALNAIQIMELLIQKKRI